jgi:hypothetical protein
MAHHYPFVSRTEIHVSCRILSILKNLVMASLDMKNDINEILHIYIYINISLLLLYW